MTTSHLFITVHAIEGNCVKGGAEGIFCDSRVCTKIAHIFTVNGSCGSRAGGRKNKPPGQAEIQIFALRLKKNTA
jgi:hypothetical protein